MASYLSPAQLTKDSHRFSSKNYRNHRLHHALDEAKNYSEYYFCYAVWLMFIFFGRNKKTMFFLLPHKPIKVEV